VQVLSQDEKQIHATILAVPAERLEVSGENVVTFRESAEGTTPAVQYWYYPGDRIGHEFVYPKDQAMKIAARTGQNVLSTEGEISSSESRVSSMSPTGESTEWNREGSAAANAQSRAGAVEGTTGVSEMPKQTAEAEATTTRSPEAVTAETETPQPAAPATMAQSQTQTQSAVGTSGQRDTQGAAGTSGQTETQERELPRTASPLPLSGLIGLLALGGALTLRRVRQ
jgi:cobalamin biosynthesis Mg chelatase CobN